MRELMNKVIEGKVTYQRVSDTGDPSFDFDYQVGYESLPNLEDELSRYEGSRVKVTLVIEEIEETEENDDEDDE